jgi:GNAT superfamily N-acetyltransferase
MEIAFREITLDDAEAVAQLSHQFGYSVPIQAMRQRIGQLLAREDHCGFVACVGKQVVGWIHAFHAIRLESEAFVEIGGLVVEEDLRGQGIGRRLIEQVKGWALTQRVAKLRVRCNTTRTDTHTFYLKTGFTQSKEQKVFDLTF